MGCCLSWLRHGWAAAGVWAYLLAAVAASTALLPQKGTLRRAGTSKLTSFLEQESHAYACQTHTYEKYAKQKGGHQVRLTNKVAKWLREDGEKKRACGSSRKN